MQLVLTTRGSAIRVKEGCFLIWAPARNPSDAESHSSGEEIQGEEGKVQPKEFQVSPKKVQTIVVGESISLTSDAIQLAVEHNIDIIFLDGMGNPFGRVWHCRMGSTAEIRRRQLEAMENEIGFNYAKEWVSTKIKNRIELVEKLLRAREESKSERVQDNLKTLQEMLEKVHNVLGNLNEKRDTLMGLEGTGGRVYFDSLSELIPHRWRFNGRSRAPAKDPFNAMLNYAYGYLYGVVERALVLAGLDPYLGFLHTDGYGKKSLVFDGIEPYRILADTTVFYLFSGRTAKDSCFDTVPGGFSLNKEGKDLLIGALSQTLEESVRHRGRNLKRKTVIQFEYHRLANELLGRDSEKFDLEIEEI